MSSRFRDEEATPEHNQDEAAHPGAVGPADEALQTAPDEADAAPDDAADTSGGRDAGAAGDVAQGAGDLAEESRDAGEVLDGPLLPADGAADDFYVVGIGASAGGFEALEHFFSSMRPDSGMAFVVVQHLSPDHKSLMVELLSKHTRMQVHQATEGMVLHPDNIYLIPPKKNMTVFHGKLHLADKTGKQTLNFPIDIFFNSLAEDKGERAIAVILSGTGSDGTRGIRGIKEQGGIIMVQDLNSAKFDGMPSNAIATGLADYILPPDRMPDELLKYVQHPFVAKPHNGENKLLKEETKLEKIFSMLKSQSGVDFTHYKQSTVSRRIERRLSVNQIDKLEDYVNYLYQNPNEVQTLYKELLIGVTRFFRDPEAYGLIQNRVVPDILKGKKQGETIRVWVAGCSTGEEAYSLAILFREAMDAAGVNHEVKVFATDVDTDALEFASVGQYPENIVADLTSERFHSYFVRKGDKYQVINQIREMVIFAQHNIIKDPPFNKIDLLTCRNLLIYLQTVLQKKVLMNFNFALNDGGFMFLGSSETIGHFTNLFSPYDTKWKIYRSKGKQSTLPVDSFSITPVHRKKNVETVFDRFVPQHVDHRKQVAGIYETVFNEYAPPAAIINRNHELVHVLGDVSNYLRIQPGNVSLNIATLIRKELSIAVETGLNKALRDKKEVHYNEIQYTQDGQRRRVNLRIVPQQAESQENDLLLVIFDTVSEAQPAPARGESFDFSEANDQRFQDLEHELQYTRENLQATIEELETTNEELQATNEELLSANEELQSANEELQSVNEELITVNSEYQSKIQELTELNNDMNNLLLSTNIGTIFLDKDLRIRKFTPAISKEINLMDTDIGRPISHIVFNINYDNILGDSHHVLHTLTTVEREVQTQDGEWLLLRILPYRTDDDIIKGVVLTFIDISSLKRATAELHKLSYAVELSHSIIVISDPEGNIEYVNKSFSRITGYSPEEVLGKNARIFKTGKTSPEEYKTLWKSVSEGRSWSGTFVNRKKNREIYYEEAHIVPIVNDKGEVVNLLKVAEDVTEQRKSREMLEQSRLRVLHILESTTDSYVELDDNWRFMYVNQKAEGMLGKSRDDLLGRQIWDIFPETVQSRLFKELHRAKSNQENVALEEYLAAFDVWFEFHVFPDDDTISIYFRDVTQRKRTENRLRESEERFRSTFAQAAVGLAHCSPSGEFLRINDRFCQIVDSTCEELRQSQLEALVHQDDLPRVQEAMRSLLQNETPNFSVEARLRKGEASVWTILTGSMVDDEYSKGRYMILVVEDISLRRAAEDELAREHELFQSITDLSPVSITVVDSKGKLIFVNEEAANLFGMEHDALTARTFNDPKWHITDVDGGAFPEEELPFNQVMRSKKAVFNVRHAIENEAGERRQLSINSAPVLDAAGEVQLVVNTIMDITEDLARRRELQGQRTHLEQLVAQRNRDLEDATSYLDMLNTIFVGLDDQGRVRLTNKRACELFGRSRKEFLGLDWFETCLPPDKSGEVREAFRRIMAGELDPFEQYESPVVDRHGQEIPVRWHNKVTYDVDGSINGTLSSGRLLNEHGTCGFCPSHEDKDT